MIFEFKIGGMTCISCARTIESAIKKEFGEKGLIEVQIAVLTQKMRLTFRKSALLLHGVKADTIIEEIELIGFTAELLEMLSNNPQEFVVSDEEDIEDEESCREINA